jgi:uncharacterized protein (DUF1778 family)
MPARKSSKRALAAAATKPTTRSQKNARLTLRVTEAQKQLLQSAASLQETTVTSFILEQSCEAAELIIGAKTHFVLDDEHWKAFCDALEAPPKEIPALRRLFQERTILDG